MHCWGALVVVTRSLNWLRLKASCLPSCLITHDNDCTHTTVAGRLTKSADGFELTWAVNVLAPFLLTSLLIDKVPPFAWL